MFVENMGSWLNLEGERLKGARPESEEEGPVQ